MKIVNKYIQQLPAFIGLLALLAISACKKDKVNFEYDNRVITDARKSSSVRIVNLGPYGGVVIDGDTLTSTYIPPVNPAPGQVPVVPGTKYFPEGGSLGTTWSVPQSLLKGGKAHADFILGALTPLTDKISIDLDEGNGQGTDYYLQYTELLPTGMPGQPKYLKVPRDVSAPSDPTKFKVRILNLSAIISRSEFENLVGPLSLAWADGTSVSDKTNNILPGQYSDYVELPYTTAQLKVLTPAGIQVPGITSRTTFQSTSTLSSGRGGGAWPPPDSKLTFSAFRSFAPGGIYTIVISPYNFTVPYINGNPGETYKDDQSAIRIINDISEPLNTTYARVQAVNTLPGVNDVKFTMNGQALGAALTYTDHTDYQSYIIGKYIIEAKNAAGAILATNEVMLDPNTNFTLWLHPDANGKATISPVANNLSNIVPRVDANDDATYVRNKLDYPFSIRFLNLCPDMPYATFTKNDGQAFSVAYNNNPDAVNNLRPGIFPTVAPYIQLDYDDAAYKILAYRSQPGIVPGSWASDIPVLTGQDLIARPALYVRNGLPNHEPGVYTIALVGRTDASAPAGQKAKMIILKHTK